MKPRRRFSPRLRRLAALVSAGRCIYCGVRLTAATFHADHLHAFSKGGKTTLENIGASCASCNLSKGSNVNFKPKHFIPRRNQTEAYASFTERCLVQGQTNWLGVVCTGGGKTHIGAGCAARALKEKKVRFVVVVTFGETQRGWMAAMMTHGVRAVVRENGDLHDALDNPVGVPADAQCLLVSYQQLVADPRWVRQHVEIRGGTLVIFDEPQHSVDLAEAAFSTAMLHTFGDAKHRMFLTATPVRTDREKLPFLDDGKHYVESADASGINYNGEVYTGRGWKLIADYEYSYRDGLDEVDAQGKTAPVVRPLGVTAYDADAVLVDDRAMTRLYLDFGVRAGDVGIANARLRTCIDLDSDAAKRMMDDAVAKVLELREQDRKRIEEIKNVNKTRAPNDQIPLPNAKLLVVCDDQKNAKRAQERVMKQYRMKAHCIVSDPEREDGTVDQFRIDNVVVATSVQRISEGVDVPEIRVILWLTNVTTEMRWVQIVGRALRNPRNDPSEFAFIYMPADPRYITYARTFRDATLDFVNKREGKPGEPPPPNDGPRYRGENATHKAKEGVDPMERQHHDADLMTQAEKLRTEVPGLAGIAASTVATLIRKVRGGNAPTDDTAKREPTVERADDDEEVLRAAVTSKVSRIVKRTGREHEVLYKRLHKHVNDGQPKDQQAWTLKSYTLASLRRANAVLDQWEAEANAGVDA